MISAGNDDDTKRHDDAQLLKPSLTFESVTFSNGSTLAFDDDEIVVFVGPNNAGKSAALRELEAFAAKNHPLQVIRNAVFRRVGNAADLLGYLTKHAMKVGKPGQHSFAGMGFNFHHAHCTYFENQQDRSPVANFFCARLTTEQRLTSADPAEGIALYQDPPTHPIHTLMLDDKLCSSISALFRHAFGVDLIPFRAGGSRFPLYVGQKPMLSPGEDELMKSYVDRLLSNAVPLQQQGDGMRSFASILLRVLVPDVHSILLLDEPEAFLHPPQARLMGEFIARERKSKSQLFIATHSTDFVDGLISEGLSKVRIIRIQREGAFNRVRELSSGKTAAIAKDTLARYSRVFDGIFYQHVVICEGDADCLFYSSILKLPSVTGKRRADVLFIHTSGKHRMAQLAQTLRELDVPVSAIADVDLFKEESTAKRLFETLGGDWSTVKGHFDAIKTAVENRKPPLNAEQVAKLIRDAIGDTGGTGEFPKAKEREINRIFRSLSPWAAVKESGRSAIPVGGATQHYDQLLEKAASVGLWIVPVGEIEGFCRSIEGGHGPSFVTKVMEERDIATDPELQEARDFVREIWHRAMSEEVIASAD